MKFLTGPKDVIVLDSLACRLPPSATCERTYLLRDLPQ
jgi:hypothetical protein